MSPANAPWRLLLDGPCDGADNMALDRAIQLAHAAGEVPPTLRIYRWTRPTVSLGRFQSLDGVDRGVCASAGIDIVRRFTGGRGVLHADEVTYCVVAGRRDGVPRGVAASYRHLSAGLAAAYRLLGVPATLTARSRGTKDSSACYLHTTQADLSLGAAKLSGSAQVWHEETCMQHGSFTRTRDRALEASVFCLTAEEKRMLAETTVTLSDARGAVPEIELIEEAIAGGMAQALSVEIVLGEVTQGERQRAGDLLAETRIVDNVNVHVSA